MQVEVWSDIVCPWCYLGKRHLEQALASLPFGDTVQVTFRSFELDSGAASGTTTETVAHLAGKYGMSREQAEQVQRQMEQRAAQDGLTFRMGALRSGNTRAAHRLLHLAKDRGVQADLVEALHRAYFTEQRDIFDPESLAAIGQESGLDRGEAATVLDNGSYDDAVETDEEIARSLGAHGVPFFVIDRRFAVQGAQPAAVLAEVLQRAYAEPAAS